MDSQDIIKQAIKKFWKEYYPCDVVAFFYQKYDYQDDNKWEWCEELVEAHGDFDYDNMTFLYDFCEGQTCVKDVRIVPLCEVTEFFTIQNGIGGRKTTKQPLMKITPVAICEIPLKLPSLNEYINACRENAYAGAKMKKQTQEDIMWFVKKLPKFDKPIFIHFHWVEGNRKRDYDNISGAGHKFILDAMVKCGKLKDDNRNFVRGYTDTFGYERGVWKVILEIEEGD